MAGPTAGPRHCRCSTAIMRRWGLIAADSRTLLAAFPDASVDAVVTDPPYGLNFNQQAWDGGALASGEGFQAFTAAWASETAARPQARRLPGGVRCQPHRSSPRRRDRGCRSWRCATSCLWMYGSGVPKSRRGCRAGWARRSSRPTSRSCLPGDRLIRDTPATLANVARHGTGALNIDTRSDRAAEPPSRPARASGRPTWRSATRPGAAPQACQSACAARLIDDDRGS